ncbi:unnamed protein product [Lactuca virosa]|uniref:Uncharacterized protein n=1 Tax=Lactuca virosa TaxID=75947 RepID=A0AAU9NMB2_9ASTR|nr:unnamed protein product [Lactuca virosa]
MSTPVINRCRWSSGHRHRPSDRRRRSAARHRRCQKRMNYISWILYWIWGSISDTIDYEKDWEENQQIDKDEVVKFHLLKKPSHLLSIKATSITETSRETPISDQFHSGTKLTPKGPPATAPPLFSRNPPTPADRKH